MSCLCCKWRKNKRPVHSVVHGAAENAFADAIAQLVLDPMDVCATIRLLDAQVQHGTVRRQAAGHMASRLYAASPLPDAPLAKTLLWIVATHMNRTRCDCMYRVLDWGCCPTVMTVIIKGEGFASLTARGHYSVRGSWTVLSAQGSLPWHWYNCKMHTMECGDSRVVMESVDPAYSPAPCVDQWKQWHGRRGRRLWTSVFVAFHDGLC